MPQKQDEVTKNLDEKKKDDKQNSLRSHSYQGQHKKKANTSKHYQDNDVLCQSNPHTDNQLEQEDRKDVMDQQQSNSDDQHIQDDSKTLAEDANVSQKLT